MTSPVLQKRRLKELLNNLIKFLVERYASITLSYILFPSEVDIVCFQKWSKQDSPYLVFCILFNASMTNQTHLWFLLHGWIHLYPFIFLEQDIRLDPYEVKIWAMFWKDIKQLRTMRDKFNSPMSMPVYAIQTNPQTWNSGNVFGI